MIQDPLSSFDYELRVDNKSVARFQECSRKEGHLILECGLYDKEYFKDFQSFNIEELKLYIYDVEAKGLIESPEKMTRLYGVNIGVIPGRRFAIKMMSIGYSE